MAKSIILSDEKKINDIWKQNYDECSQSLNQIFLINNIFYQQQLGLEYAPPQQLIENIKNIKNPWDEKKLKNSVKIADKIISAVEKPSELPMETILGMLCSDGEFLVEKRLTNVLRDLNSTESLLIGIDAVLSALNITDEAQVAEIIEFFVEYQRTHSNLLTDESFCSVSENEVVYNQNNANNMYLHPNYVLHVLNEYVQQQRKYIKNKISSKTTLNDLISDFDGDTNYCWEEFVKAGKNEQALWETMTINFEKYRKILKKRIELSAENDSLEKQNGELRALIKEYFNSDINNLLQIPPAMTISFGNK